MMNHKKRLLIFLLILVMLIASGCTKQDWSDLIDFGKFWAMSNDVINEDGKPSLSAIARVGFGFSTGDPSKDAAIDASQVVDNFGKAEKLSEQGLAEHDISKVDEAINRRPKDYSYRNQKAAMLFFQDDYAGTQAEFNEADQIAQGQSKNTQIRNLESRLYYLNEEFNHVMTDVNMPQAEYDAKLEEYRGLKANINEEIQQLKN